MLTTADGEVIYVFLRVPNNADRPAGQKIVIGAIPAGTEQVDLAEARWLTYPRETPPSPRDAARASWKAAFRYISEEDAGAGRIGLRKPQVGALHAIHAHWSTTSEVATVVMPTGTGKTETMLATLVTARCERVLVLVPTVALRRQVAEKFYTLGVLKQPSSVVLEPGAVRPVVGLLKQRPTTPAEVDEFFERCNVIVMTSALAAQCVQEVRERMAELCTDLFIDEAHHAEAPTWKRFKKHFKARDRRILQFTATPFREDGLPLDGKIVYVYPLRLAQRERVLPADQVQACLRIQPGEGRQGDRRQGHR